MKFKQTNWGILQGALIALLFFAACYFILPYGFSQYTDGDVEKAYKLIFSYGNLVQEKVFSLSAIGILLPFYFFFKKQYNKQAYGCIFVAMAYTITLIAVYL
tara:strand:- start:1428 stop:1733 length:306 start_codon:yes stop_codon:yes gene_type:complete